MPPPPGLISFYWHYTRQTVRWYGVMFVTSLAVALIDTDPQAFEKRFTQLGGKIAGRESYATGANNVNTAVSRLNGRKADVILVSARRRTPPKEQLDAIRAHVAAGKAVVVRSQEPQRRRSADSRDGVVQPDAGAGCGSGADMSRLSLEQMAPCFQGLVPAMFFTCAKDGTPNAAFLSHVDYVDPTHVARRKEAGQSHSALTVEVR